MNDAQLADAIDRILPQTQCRRCGYPACRPYAEAIAAGATAINRCPPGGEAVIHALASMTRRPYAGLDPSCGTEAPRRVARVDEARCIGCTLCIQACPVDAIVGGPRRMHTVVIDLCTGCDLCIPPCPVDCIEMVAPRPVAAGWDAARADAARSRYLRRQARLARTAGGAQERGTGTRDASAPAQAKRAAVEAAFERARARREAFAARRRAHGR